MTAGKLAIIFPLVLVNYLQGILLLHFFLISNNKSLIFSFVSFVKVRVKSVDGMINPKNIFFGWE